MVRVWIVAVIAAGLWATGCDRGTPQEPVATPPEPVAAQRTAAPSLTPKTREALADYGLQVLDAHLGGQPAPTPPALEDPFEYQQVFVTLYTDGRIRGCQAGDSGKLGPDTAEAVVRSINDKRFGGVMEPAEAPDTDINLTFLYNRRPTSGPKLEYEPGVHAIEVLNGERRAFFKAEVPITKNYSRKKTLKRLCKKARLPKDCASSPDTSIFVYDTLTFHKRRGGPATLLLRGNPAEDPTLDEALLTSRLALARRWFSNNINADSGLLEYEHLPSEGRWSEDNNHVRQLGSLWAISRLLARASQEGAQGEELARLRALGTRTLDHYLQFRVQREGHSFLKIEGQTKLAFNAFTILALANLPDHPQRLEIADDLARGLLQQQRPDGSFATHFESDKNSGVEFYPGEAMLALMTLHGVTGNRDYLQAVERAFPHYRDYWRANRNTPMLSWHSQTYRLLYEATGDRALAEHTFELNDWLLEQQITDAPHPDVLGGFSRKGTPNIASATYLEGLLAALAVARKAGDQERARRYADAARRALAYALRLQFTADNSFYLKRPEPALGGFRHSLTENNLRNDNTQHAAMAILGALELKLAEP